MIWTRPYIGIRKCNAGMFVVWPGLAWPRLLNRMLFADASEHDLHFPTFKHVHSLLILCKFSCTLQINHYTEHRAHCHTSVKRYMNEHWAVSIYATHSQIFTLNLHLRFYLSYSFSKYHFISTYIIIWFWCCRVKRKKEPGRTRYDVHKMT